MTTPATGEEWWGLPVTERAALAAQGHAAPPRSDPQRSLGLLVPEPDPGPSLSDLLRDRALVERMARIARVLVKAALANECIQEWISDPAKPWWTEAGVRAAPTVRVHWEQAIATGCLGEVLAVCKRKSWGAGPQVLPLEPEDWVDPMFITYEYLETSTYNRRFEQRKALKTRLGREHRPLVGKCRKWNLGDWLEYGATPEVRRVLLAKLGLTAREFWQQVHGLVRRDTEFTQRTLFTGDSE